jgi:transcriptional regulator with XRE-family HTH domain
MSQEALAADAKLETMHVSRIERGLANPTLKVVERLARALKVDAVQLFVLDKARAPSGNLTAGRKPRPRRRLSGSRQRA